MGQQRKFKVNPNLGALIHNTRIAKGMTMREIAAEVGMTPSYLCDIEHGNHEDPGFMLICKLADVLKIPMMHLKSAAMGDRE